jgi:two-component system alkaline phosphatase synthesis response regulator PhoP
MATARTSEFDKVTGLDSGADDYLAKPFGMMEMVSRVKAVLRRSRKNPVEQTVQRNEITVDKAKHVVKLKDEKIDLTPKEYELLLCLMEDPGIVFSRDQLLEKIWGLDYLGESRTIDVHINTLRNKLGPYGKYIVTMHGIGYFFKEDQDG